MRSLTILSLGTTALAVTFALNFHLQTGDQVSATGQGNVAFQMDEQNGEISVVAPIQTKEEKEGISVRVFAFEANNVSGISVTNCKKTINQVPSGISVEVEAIKAKDIAGFHCEG